MNEIEKNTSDSSTAIDVSPNQNTPILSTEKISTQSNVPPLEGNDNGAQFLQWLSQYKVGKLKPYTHTSMSFPPCSYYIPDNQLTTLYRSLSSYLKSGGGVTCSLTEKHLANVSPVVIDFDFKFKRKPTTRLVTDQLIEQIIKLYHHHYRQLGAIDNDSLATFSLYRDDGYQTDKEYKDGFHLQIPFLVTNYQVHFEVRLRVIKDLQPLKETLFPDTINPLEQIIDELVIQSNGWLLLGCNKPNLPPYQIKQLYMTDGEESLELRSLKDQDLDDMTLTSILSLRWMISKQVTDLSVPTEDGESKPIHKEPSIKSIIPVMRLNDHDYNQVLQLVPLLSQQRSDDRSTWIEVGLCLHNMDLNFLPLWLEFSRKSNKYNESVCIKEWNGFGFKADGLKLGSLHLWAKQDNPEGYKALFGEPITQPPLKGLDKTLREDEDPQETTCVKPVVNPIAKKIFHPKLIKTRDPIDGCEDLHIKPNRLNTFMITAIEKDKTTVIIDKERTVRYLNRFLIYINESNPPQLIEITDQFDEGHIIRRLVGLEKHFNPFYSFYKVWLGSPDRRTVVNITYTPYLKNPPPEDSRVWNTFTGFKHKYDPNFVVDMDLIATWLDLINSIWLMTIQLLENI